MGIVEDAKKELDLIGFGERESRVMTDILRQFVHTFDSGGAFAAAAPVLKRLLDGKPVAWLALPPAQAMEFGKLLLKHAGAKAIQVEF